MDEAVLIGRQAPWYEKLFLRHGFGESLVFRNLEWRATEEPDGVCFRFLGGALGEAAFRGGILLDGSSISKIHVAVWLPESVWRRFRKLVEKRFPEDSRHRRLFKLTWSGGRWTLWGHSARVLEAHWQ